MILPLLFFSIAKGKLLTYILPCFAPLAMLMAASAVDLLKEERAGLAGQCLAKRPVRPHLPGGAGRAGVLPSHAVYGEEDHGALAVAMVIFAGWSLLGFIQLKEVSRRWTLSALCPMVLAIGLPWALPQSLIDSKLPERFIEANQAVLMKSGTLLANDVGLASSLAWETQRSGSTCLTARARYITASATRMRRGATWPVPTSRPGWNRRAEWAGGPADEDRSRRQHRARAPADETIVSHRLTLLIYHGAQ